MYNCYNYLEPCALNVDPPPHSPLKKGKTKSLSPHPPQKEKNWTLPKMIHIN
jgi:hypothetical protein